MSFNYGFIGPFVLITFAVAVRIVSLPAAAACRRCAAATSLVSSQSSRALLKVLRLLP